MHILKMAQLPPMSARAIGFLAGRVDPEDLAECARKLGFQNVQVSGTGDFARILLSFPRNDERHTLSVMYGAGDRVNDLMTGEKTLVSMPFKTGQAIVRLVIKEFGGLYQPSFGTEFEVIEPPASAEREGPRPGM